MDYESYVEHAGISVVGLDNEQIEQVYEGCVKRLKTSQIKFYAKPCFTAEQMKFIRLGFEAGLPIQTISYYAYSRYRAEQMEQMYLGFCDGLTIEQVNRYARVKYDKSQMEMLRNQITRNAAREFVEKYIHENVDSWITWVKEAIKEGMSVETMIIPIMQVTSDYHILEQAVRGFANGLYWESQIKKYALAGFDSAEKAKQVRLGFENGLAWKSVMFYAKNFYSAGQMEQIRLGLENGVSLCDVCSNYADESISPGMMSKIRKQLENNRVFA